MKPKPTDAVNEENTELDDILMRLKDCAKHEDKDHVPFGERCITRYQAKAEIQKKIAQEANKAVIDTINSVLKACPTKDHMLRLWLEQYLSNSESVIQNKSEGLKEPK
jgi:hypothetical protein